MILLGKEIVAAMSDVEGQQQQLTLERLITMVEAEHNYHKKILNILDQLEIEGLGETFGSVTIEAMASGLPIGIRLLVLQQLSGTNDVLFYSTTIFEFAGDSNYSFYMVGGQNRPTNSTHNLLLRDDYQSICRCSFFLCKGSATMIFFVSG